MKEMTVKYIDKEKASYYPTFFKTGKGEYGEGDIFIGVTVPSLRKVARKYYKEVGLPEAVNLLEEPIHEYRLLALFILVYKYEKAASDEDREEIVNVYLNSTQYINNWDLVDSSADKILGAYFYAKDKKVIYDFANSTDLWKQRIAIISTFYFIRKGCFDDTLRISKILLHHKHDLIHKAVGWMLREVGKRNFEVEFQFLKEHYKEMPRTMLRYAIERFDEELRQSFLKGHV